MNKIRNVKVGLGAAMLALLLLLLVPAIGHARHKPANKRQKDVVYVCACLKTKSCSCMSEAKTGGPCACGTQGGPPMQQVPHDSSWAKYNRDVLAQ
ncbi:MAG: hypothetical protein ACRECH_09660 [Nitrososphaerales archaeon]